MYNDIDDSWMFNEQGDLKINQNYRQSIKHRLLCPLHYLNIYYENYGSNLYLQLGEKYNKDIVFDEVSNTLKQDVNIYNYQINEISFINGELILSLTINGDDVWFSYHIFDEINKFIDVDCSIFHDNGWKMQITLNINSEEHIFVKNLNDLFGTIETISYINCNHKNELIEVDLIVNGYKHILKYNLNGELLNYKKQTLKIIYDEVDEKPLYISANFNTESGNLYNLILNSDEEEKSIYIDEEEQGYWRIIDSGDLSVERVTHEDGVTTIILYYEPPAML